MTTNKPGLMPSQPCANQIQNGSLSAPSPTYRNWLKAGDVMRQDIAIISPKETVVLAAWIMSRSKISCLIVMDDGLLSGIVTEADVLKKAVANGDDFRTMKVEQIMSSPVRSIPHSLLIVDACKIMEVENIRRLVVQEEGRVVGIITQTDAVRVMASYILSKEVSEIMTSDVTVLASWASVKEAAILMASQDISCVVVVENDAIVGIFTERDLLRKVVEARQNPSEIKLKKVMSEPVVTIPSSYSLLSATKLLERKGIRHLVVMEHETLVGIITQTDILKALKSNLQEEEENYFRLLSESGNCVYTVDPDLNTTYVNRAFMELLDVRDPNELIDKPFLPERFWEIPEQRERLMDQLRKVRVTVDEFSLKTMKGGRLSVILFNMPNKNLKGEVNGSHGILYDTPVKQ